MSKNVEIVYADFKGLHVEAPENKIPPEYSPNTQNFFVRNNELRSRPTFHTILPAPSGPHPVLGTAGFFDATGQLHTVAICPQTSLLFENQIYQLTPANTWQPVPLGGSVSLPVLNAITPVQWRVYGSVLYFCNGTVYVGFWDGINDWQALDTMVTQPFGV